MIPDLATPDLPQLRQELKLHRGPRLRDGSPSWTLEDPARGQFFRLGWAEVEMLARWETGNSQRVLDAVNTQTSLTLDIQDVKGFAAFLGNLQLVRTQGPEGNERLLKISQQNKHGWAGWLMHNYLFVRIPLVNPDAFLERTLPWVRPLMSRGFALLTLMAALTGLILVARQWDVFVHTFLHFFSLEGALLAAMTLGCTKVLHELGHAYTCKRFGCRVASMGVALLVMWPVLYTDTTGAWRLTARRQRLAIGAAGMLVELSLAAWATLLWSFLPDGPLRSAAFMLATTTWILTLAINLSPLMRFDGYFLLSDALDVPNLQGRGFALARWRLREWLFGLDDPRPEVFEPWLERTLLIYAFGTWIYRFFLFLGIALLVYHFAFKLLGLLLFAVEIGVFILMPIFRELQHWAGRRKDYRMNRNTLITTAVLAALLLGVCLPWRSSVQAPALLRASQQATLLVPNGARLQGIDVRPGQIIERDQPMFRLEAPTLTHELSNLELQIKTLSWQLSFQRMDKDAAARLPVVQRELDTAQERYNALRSQIDQLQIRAPFDGTLVDMAEPLAVGQWLPPGEWLATLAAPGSALIEAFVSEQDMHRIAADNSAWFYPEDLSRPRIELQVTRVEQTAVRKLASAPELASDYQGGIATRLNKEHEPVPEQAVYRVLLQPSAAAQNIQQALRGSVSIDAETRSPLIYAWQKVVAVLIREAAF
ncbi:HlyD family efflux transporter periplasmic adaptor subunit [Pseudomonas cichorii]|uniref:HlyD family efflux transporter periplasmic adaptor subunit n=1 Tax=Pseudomonas cichorii TaxID=36746 RepID=UPI001C89EBF9|nr:HlyD family efflux transporter periplasmic adaptor subunit [Pseudomonas cichorii]MBX8495451.1 HlyD family efflux transporter periplasmic adaptor subunit [Pseudomonas cichorii]